MKQFSNNSNVGRNMACPWFSTLILFVLVLFSTSQVNAQAITSYSFAQSSGTYTQAGLGASLTSSGCFDDGGFSAITLPFTFTYHGTNFSFIAPGPNGYAQLNNSGSSATLGYSAICAGSGDVLSALNADLYGCVSNGGDFSYVTSGASPNRVFTMQWSQWGFWSSGLNEFSFQIKLYETSNKIQFIYQNGTATSSGTAYVGLTGTSSADFQGRTTTSNWNATTAAGSTCGSTCTINSSVRPTNGLTFTWTAASTVAAMAFAQTTTTYVPVVGSSSSSSLTSSGCYDDGGFSAFALPFTFNYHGTNYSFAAPGPNGYAQLNNSGSSATLGYSAICTGNTDVLSPLNYDLYGCTSVNGDYSYTTLGTAPNRTLVMQWSNWGFWSSGLNEFSFQIRLQETTNTITYMYGPSPGTSSATVYVGLNGATNSDFQGRTTTTNWSATTAAGSTCGMTNTISSSVRPTNGLMFTWSPPSCSNPTVSVSPTSTTMCAGQSVALTASGTATTWTWAPAAGLNTTTGTNVTATPSSTTTYTVTGSVTGGCTSTATSVVTIQAAPTPTVTATPPAVCSGGTSQLAAVTNFTLVYNIPLSQLVNCTSTCGANSYYNGCGGSLPGFNWADIGSGAVTGVSVQFAIGVECGAQLHFVSLNGNAQSPTFTSQSWCNCSGESGGNQFTLALNPSNYTVGGTNTFLITNPNSCLGYYAGIAGYYAKVTVTYGSSGNTYSWSPTTFLNDPTSPTPVASGITSTTTYTVSVTSSAGCTASGSTTVTAGGSLSASITQSNSEVCIGTCDTLRAIASGTAPYTYSWSPGGATTSLIVVCPSSTTTYTCTVTDNCGSSTSPTATATVTNPTPIVTPTSGGYCIGSGGSVTFTASGGAASYDWAPAAGLNTTTGATVVASPSVTTTYTVTGHGAGSSVGHVIYTQSFTSGANSPSQCTAWDTWRAQLTPQSYTKLTLKGSNDPVGISITDPTVINQIAQALNTNSGGSWTSGGHNWYLGMCGNGLELMTVASGTNSICNCANPAYSIRPCIGNLNWGGIAGATCSAPSQEITVDFEIIAGCNATSTVTVNVADAPSVSATATPSSVCTGGTSQLAAVTSSTQEYHLGLSNLVNVPNNCGGGSLYSDCGAGQPGFTWTDVGSGTATSITMQFGIGVDCNGSGVSHTVLLNGNNVGSVTPSGNWCSCSFNDNVVTVNASTTGYNVGGSNTILFTSGGTCFGFINNTGSLGADYVVMTVTYGSSGNTFSWSPSGDLDDPTSQTPIASNIATTTTYTVTADNGSCTATATTTVSAGETFVVDAPVATPASSGSGSYCIPLSGYGCGFPDVITSVVYAGINNNTGTTCGQGSDPGYNPLYTSPNPTITAGVANTLTVMTGGDTEGMAAWIDYDQDGEFESGELVLNGYQGSNPATYSGSVTIPTSALNGTTRMRVRCMYAGDPSGIGPCATIFYTECEDYLITIEDGTAISTLPCPGTTWTLSTEASGGGLPYSYFWEGPGLVTNDEASVTAIIDATSTYTVTVTDNCGGSSVQTVIAEVQDVTVSVTPSSTTQCDYESVELTASGTSTSFAWAPPTGLDVTTGPTVNASPLVTTTYTVTGTAGACTITATAVVNVNQSPVVSPTATPSTICVGGCSQLDATAYTLGYVNYSDYFTAGTAPTNAQCNTWNNFAAQLAPQNYIKITIKGSNDPTGVYVDDPSVVQQIAAAMYGGYDGTWTSNGRQWHVSHCAGLELGADESSCICYNPGYEIRPCIATVYPGNANWGGINSYTCSGFGSVPNQTMEVEFQYANPAPTTSYSWSPSGFLDDASSATPQACGLTETTTFTVTTNIAGCSGSSSTGTVTISAGEDLAVTTSANPPAPSGYCIPGQSPNSCFYMFITEVTIQGTTLHNPSGCATSSFILYPATGNTTATLTAGTTYTMTLASIANAMNFTVWIDADHSGTYTSDEIVINNFQTMLAANTTFTVPSTTVNHATRMRVKADWYAAAPVTDPCNTLSYGETEDYIINVEGGVELPACPGNPWDLTASVTGGGEPYDYLWSGPGLVTNNSATVTAIPTATTTYTVSVSDACGSIVEQTLTVDVQDVSASIDVTSNTQCDNQSVVLTASGSAQSWTWAPAAGLNTTAGNVVTANPQVTTTYTVTAHNGVCTASATSVITVNASPVITATATPQNICVGGTSQLDAGTSGATAVYNITSGMLVNCPSNCGSTGSFYNGCGGAQPGFTWTDIGSGSVASISITLAIGIDCANGTRTVGLNGVGQSPTFFDNYWCYCDGQTGGNTFTLTWAPTSYNVGGTNTFNITNPASCLGFFPGVSGYYAQVTVTYSGGGTTVLWTPSTFLDDPSSSTPVASNVTATTTYTVTADNGTCTSTSELTVYVDPLVSTPTATTSGPSAYCNPTLFPTNGCNPINNISTSGGITNISNLNSHYNGTGYNYFSSQTVSQDAGSPFTLSVQSEGYCVSFSYYYVWVDWDQNGVFDNDEEIVHNVNCGNTLTDFTINVPSDALDGNTRMRVMCDGSGFGDRTPCHNLTAYYSEVEDYNLMVVNGVIPGPPCAGSASFQLSAGVTGGGSPYTYDWQPTSDLDNPSIENPVATPTVTTTYTVTVADICGNVTSGEITLEVTPLPTVTVSPASSDVCPGYAPITLTADGADFYSWSPAAGLNTTVGAVVIASPAVSTTYEVTGSQNGCTNTASASINVSPVVSVSATATPDVICPGGCSTLEAIGSAGGGGGTTYIVSSIAYAPVSGSQTFVSLGDDQVSGALNIGFGFPYFGTTFTQFYISSNGFITFDAGSPNGCCTGQFIPNPGTPNNYLALCHEDYYPPAGGTIGYFTTGSQCVIQWTSIGHYSSGSFPMTGQIVLNADGSIQFHATSISTDFDGVGETMGIENGDGTVAYVIEGWNSTDPWSATNESWSFTPFSTNITYSWEPSDNLDDASIQSPTSCGLTSTTTYTVTATSNVGCTASNTVTVSIADTTFGGLSEDYCEGDGAVLLSPVTPGGTFSGPGVVFFQGDYYFDPATSGIGVFNISYGLPIGCGSTQVTEVHALPVVTLAPFDPVCANDPPFVLTQGSPSGGFYFDQFGYVTGGNTFDPGAAGPGTHTIFYQYFDEWGCSAFQQGDIEVGNPTTTVYADIDGDGYGAGDPIMVCVQPSGTSLTNDDCNDNDAAVNPGATEVCGNLIDDNCDGSVDENCTIYTYYADVDQDGYGDPANFINTTELTPPPGYVTDNTDCDDSDASVHEPQLYYVDSDLDGYGSTTTAMVCSSTAPTGYSTTSDDCNDGNAAVNPGATDICNGVDDNCDGTLDENPLVATVTPSGTVTECRTVPVTLSASPTYPGISYQWYKGTALQAGETNSTFTTTKRGSFRVVETTSACSSTSPYTTVARLAIPQASITVYSTLDLCSTGSVQLRANNAGAHGIGYQWNKGGIPIVGATDRPFIATSTGDYTVTVYGNTGCNVTSSSVTVYSSCKGSEPVLFSSELSLYPNPNRGDFMVELNFSDNLNAEADVQVINTLSQTIYMNRTAVVNGKLMDEVKFDHSVAAGNYLVRVIVGDKVYTGQITYQK